MSGLMSIGGLASGIDTNNIIDQLQQIAQAPITRKQQEKADLQAKYQAWNQAATRLLAVKEKAAALQDLAARITKSASSSNSTVGVSAAGTAVDGNYQFLVSSISTYHQLTSQAYADKDVTSVGNGTFSITVGDTTTDIDVNGLTLEGLRDAINAGGSGASAFIVNDGATTPSYRLVLTSGTLGSAGTITTGDTLAGGTSPILSELTEATDTSLTFGSGAGAFTVTRAGNSLTDVIPGVTLNVSGDAIGKTVTVSVTSSKNGVKAAIQDFVAQYNAFLDFVDSQNQYDPDSGATGTLFGENRLHQITGDLFSTLTNPLTNLSGEYNSVVALGITTGNDGRLHIDDTTLSAALRDHPDDVFNLFGNSGQASNSAVSYVGSTGNTEASTGAGYAVHVTQLATHSQLNIGGIGGAGLPEVLGADETLTLNNTIIPLTAGMTRVQVVEAINARVANTKVVAALDSAQHLVLTHAEYGPAYSIVVSSNREKAADSTGIGTITVSNLLPGSDNSGTVGQNVAGTINGGEATGNGQVLTGKTGNAEGLSLKIDTDTLGDGNFGAVVFTKGVGTLLTDALAFTTDVADGVIQNVQTGLESQMTAIDESITDLQAGVAREMTRVRNQFNAMEVMLSKLQSQGNQLSQLIGQLPSYSSSSSQSS